MGRMSPRRPQDLRELDERRSGDEQRQRYARRSAGEPEASQRISEPAVTVTEVLGAAALAQLRRQRGPLSTEAVVRRRKKTHRRPQKQYGEQWASVARGM